MNPWSKYWAGPASSDDWDEMEEVSHVTHIENAVDIVRAQRIQPRLVSDESILKSRRIQVVWLSPNYWYDGFRYGSISFDFPWKYLIRNRRAYWIEAMTAYHPAACRILITNVDRGDRFEQYDSKKDDGPWRYNPRTNKHFRNKAITLEFMLEATLELEDCTTTTFVEHHDRFCSMTSSGCRERSLNKYAAGAEFVAGIIGREIDAMYLKMKRIRQYEEFPSLDLKSAIANLLGKCQPAFTRYRGAEPLPPETGKAIARSVAMAFANRNRGERLSLASLFSSYDELEEHLLKLISTAFYVDCDDCGL